MIKQKTIHLVLSKDDTDIIAWKNVLPSRTFNKFVNEILIAESKGKIADIPYGFSSVKEVAPIHCRIVIKNGSALDYLAKIPKGQVSLSIKKIIRKHIRKNRTKTLRLDLVIKLLSDFKTKIESKEPECVGLQDKYRKLCDCYDGALKNLFNEILDCSKVADQNTSDSKLKQIDVSKIIDETFDKNFNLQGDKDLCTKMNF